MTPALPCRLGKYLRDAIGASRTEVDALIAAGRVALQAPTTDPFAAMKGALLPFGGARGANIALMVEVLAAGLTGANWSLDASDFQAGDASPGAGLFVLALAL